MAFSGWFHYSVSVSNIERSLEFYQKILGLELIDVRDRVGDVSRIIGFESRLKIAWLRLPGGGEPYLELIEYVSPRGERIDTNTANVGVSHVCFKTNDLQATVAELRAKGVRFKADPVQLQPGSIWRGSWATYMLDPDDVTIEIMQVPDGPHV